MAAALVPEVLGLLLVLLSSPDFLAGYRAEEVPTGRLFSRGWGTRDREAVGRELPRALAKVERRLRRRLERPFTTVLVPDRQELGRVVKRLGVDLPSPEHVLGIALPHVRFLVLREGLLPGSGSFRTTLVHEVAHLVIHRDLSARIPRWYDEGAAMWLSGATISASQEAYLSLLARIGSLYPLAKLEYRFPRGHETTSVSYRQSLLLIRYLIERHGSETLPRLLDSFEGGSSSEEGLGQLTGVSLGELESDFATWVAARHSWLAALGSVFSVWTITSLLAVLAIARHILRRRRSLRELEDPMDPEEADPQGAPPEDPAG